MKKIYIIAIIASVMAGISLFSFLNAVKEEAKVNFDIVLTAVSDIPAHTVITEEMLVYKQIPKEGIHPQAARKSAEVVGLITTEKLFKDEQMIIPKLKKIGEGSGGLSYTIDKGMRAVSVAVDEVTGVSGFIKQGDKIDVLGIVTQDNGGTQLQSSQMILQNILVLAVGTTLVKNEEEQSAYTTVTLLVTPNDAVRLNLVSATGSMRIALRGPIDDEINVLEPRTSDNIVNR